MEERNTIVPAVMLILKKGNTILLLQRKDTWYNDGYYNVISGHVELGESFTDAVIREAKEEADITVTHHQVKVVHVQNKMADERTHQRVHVYFLATEWSGEIKNMEPHKCDDLSWFPINQLPENISPCVKAAIENIQKWAFYSEFGW
jgi:8-oxo-dGTP diphosphatase